ncbi:MAG: Crp/Fnr family transcriptional regulator [Acidimicrobiia bacterium]
MIDAHPESFLGYLDDHDLADLLTLGAERRFMPGSFLLLEGDPSNHVLLLLEGQVKVYRVAPDGSRLLLAIRGPGDVLGELAALGGQDAARGATVEALEPSRARVLSAVTFLDFLGQRPQACLALARNVRARLADAERMRVETVVHDATTRVARCLTDLAVRHGVRAEPDGPLMLRISQEELAGWVGASRESVARAMRSLRNRKFVLTRYRQIQIIDLDGLSSAFPVL